MKVFITYADERFKKSQLVLAEEIKLSRFFDKIYLFGPENIPIETKKVLEPYISNPKGGGYWIWKPIITKLVFDSLHEGDILFYADAGCTFNPSGQKRMLEYMNLLSSDKPILRFQMNHLPEREWTSTAIFDHFMIPKDSPIRDSGQCVGGIFFLYKSKLAQDQVDLWFKTALKKTALFTDIHNKENPDPRFKDNRHDQSIWSVIAKKYQNAVNFIPDETYPFLKDKPIWATRRRLH